MRLVAATALPFVALVTFAALGACSTDAAPETNGATASAIQGGVADTTHSFAVGVCGGSLGDCSVACSGVLIAPNLVATARHCVEGTNATTITCATSQFTGTIPAPTFFAITTDASMHQATVGWHGVARVLTPGDGALPLCGDDIALLVLSDVIAPSEAVPATPNVATKLTDESVFEASETAIGYGLSAGVPIPVPPDYTTTAGVRRAKEDVSIACIPNDADPLLACDADTLTKIAANEFVSGDGPCDGDSGSGAFAQKQFDDGSFLVIGVLSRGGVDANDPTICRGGIYSRLDLWRDFLAQGAIVAAQLGGYALPSWAIGIDASVPSEDASIPDAADESNTGASQLSASGGCAIARARPSSGAWSELAWLLLAAIAFLGARRLGSRPK